MPELHPKLQLAAELARTSFKQLMQRMCKKRKFALEPFSHQFQSEIGQLLGH